MFSSHKFSSTVINSPRDIAYYLQDFIKLSYERFAIPVKEDLERSIWKWNVMLSEDDGVDIPLGTEIRDELVKRLEMFNDEKYVNSQFVPNMYCINGVFVDWVAYYTERLKHKEEELYQLEDFLERVIEKEGFVEEKAQLVVEIKNIKNHIRVLKVKLHESIETLKTTERLFGEKCYVKCR